MPKWLILTFALVLIASMTGDVLLVHHHLGGTPFDAEHNTVQYTLDCHKAMIGLVGENYHDLLLGLTMNGVNRYAAKSTPGFCGWHNSAYLGGGTPVV